MIKFKSILPLFLGILATCGLVWGMAHASPDTDPVNVIYVDTDASGTATGLSWTDAYTNLQDALTTAISGTQIWVAEGVYYPDEGIDQINDAITSTFVLIDGVALYGGFAGIETSLDERDWENHVTVLSGDLEQNDFTDSMGVVTTTENITGTNAYHVLFSTGVTGTAVIDGFTISAGQANGSDSDNRGGGMYNEQSSPTLTNLAITGNSARDGGGMYNEQSSPILTDVTFSHNSAVNSGGGMANHSNSNPTLTNVTFSGNFRGGLFNDLSSPTLINVTFSGNSDRGMTNINSNPSLVNVIFFGNVGGGMANYSNSSPTLKDVTFSKNSSGYGGGMYTSNDSDPTLTNVTFSQNSADHEGGGMANYSDSNPTLTDVTFSQNSAGYGGGMYNSNDSDPLLTDITFSENSADYYGGGMVNYSNSNPILMNVTFSKNSADYGGGMYNEQSSPLLTNVDFSGNAAKGSKLLDGGGGLYNLHSCSPILINVTFFGNSAEFGGGIFNWDKSSPILINVAFSGNLALTEGGGMYNISYSNPTLTNVILWGNSAINDGNQIYNSSSTPVISYTLIQSSTIGGSWDTSLGTDGGGNIDADPLFVRNPDPGDGDWSTLEDNDYGDLHLQWGSPAIDTGFNSECSTFDLDGNPRPIGLFCDMGAYEFIVKVFLPLLFKFP